MKGTKLLKQIYIASAVLFCVGITGCRDKVSDIYKGGKEEPEKVPNDFDFSTSKQVDINLKYDVPKGYPIQFEMYTQNPLSMDEYKSYVKDTTLRAFLSGRSDESGRISDSVELSASVDNIYVYSPSIGVPILMKAVVNGTSVGALTEIEVPSLKGGRAAARAASGTNKWDTYDKVTLHKPSLSPTTYTITAEDKTAIDLSFPVDKQYTEGNSYYRSTISLKKDAHINIYFVSHSGSKRTNALAYYACPDYRQDAKGVNDKLQLAFPALNASTPQSGHGYKLQLDGSEGIKAGTNIGFALFPDVSDDIAIENVHVLYSNFESDGGLRWNHYDFPRRPGDTGLSRSSVPHMVASLIGVTNDNHAKIAIAFEDQPWDNNYGTNKGDFRDDIFIIEVTPADAVDDVPPAPDEEIPAYDMKGHNSGILAFEDCWPQQGDYDLNDVVISYERTSYKMNGFPPKIVALEEEFTFLNNGADYANGFGYQLTRVKQTDIKSCKVNSSYSCEGQGLDTSADDAIIMLFDNAKNINPKTTFSVTTTFVDGGVPGTALMNPFIVVQNGDYASPGGILASPRTEIHLPKTGSTTYLPTEKANTSYWGKEDDLSDPKSSRYYVRTGNYPFALNLVWKSEYGELKDFIIPEERKTIDVTYPEFNTWVESNGKDNLDWYNPKKQ